MLRNGCRTIIRSTKLKHSHLRPQRTFASASQTSPPAPESPQFEQVTTLSNGVRVATEAVPGHFSALGVYVNAGSRYEDDSLRGVSHLIDRLAFKSTKNKTADKMFESIESLGGNVQCASSRDSIMYQTAVFNKDVPTTMGILAETIRDPLITEEEVQQQLETAEYEIGEIWAKPELILPEMMHATAYEDNTLGNPLLCPRERLTEINRDTIFKYRNIFYQPERLVVALAGVQHQDAVRLAEQYFGDMKSGPLHETLASTNSTISNTPSSSRHSSNPSTNLPSQKSLLAKIPFFKNLSTTATSSASHSIPFMDLTASYPSLDEPARYTGGVFTSAPTMSQGTQPQFSHIYIAFESPGIADPDIYAIATLQTLLGGGGSFSAGGPGKGMYSRLYTNVLNQYGWIENCVAFNHAYTDSGLFGITATCNRNASHAIVDVILKELTNTFATTGYNALQVSEVERAKNQLRSSLLMNLESRMVELEDLGRQIQVHGRKIGPAEMCDKISALTVEDIRRVAKRVMTGQPMNHNLGSGGPTIVIQAPPKEVRSMGNIPAAVARFGLGRTK